jgi:hypothetical protein
MANTTTASSFIRFPPALLARFKAFHAANPHILEAFIAAALEMQAAGWEKYSATCIMNKIRWDTNLKTNGKPFRIDDSFTPIYARVAAVTEPALKDFFEFREPFARSQ